MLAARKTPGNQGHVTNAKDDPLQLAADAATAVAFGFDEIETTMRVSIDHGQPFILPAWRKFRKSDNPEVAAPS